MDNSKVKEVQCKLLAIAKIFHTICEENNIRYYMLGGTMLGAVRHHGFIPWDDDMDFGVMLSDFPRLKAVLNASLPSHLKVRDINNSSSVSNTMLKIEDSRYEIVEIEKEHANDCIGLNIDIFPLSRTNANERVLSRNWIAKQLTRINWCRYLDYKNRGALKNICSKAIKSVIRPFPKRALPSFIEKIIIPHKGNCVTNYWDNEIVKDRVMEPPRMYAFEDAFFWGVAQPDLYLKRLYGDYMRIPPENEIHSHIITYREKAAG